MSVVVGLGLCEREPDEDVPRKVCTQCGEEKKMTQFVVDNRLRSGRRNICHDCHNANNRAWRKRAKQPGYIGREY